MGCQRKRDPVRDIPAWKTLSSTPLADYRIAKVRAVSRLHPITGKAHDFYVMDCPDWVNIVAVTTDQRLILVRQYRHGTDTVDLEFPGGVMDAEDPTRVHRHSRIERRDRLSRPISACHRKDRAKPCHTGKLLSYRPYRRLRAQTCYRV